MFWSQHGPGMGRMGRETPAIINGMRSTDQRVSMTLAPPQHSSGSFLGGIAFYQEHHYNEYLGKT